LPTVAAQALLAILHARLLPVVLFAPVHRLREKAIERTTANRKICKRSKCRNALKAGEGFGRYHANSTQTSLSLKNPELTAWRSLLVGSGTFILQWRHRLRVWVSKLTIGKSS
jgi:hypothetical protein